MTLRELFASLAPSGLAGADDPRLLAALHDTEGSDAPLLVRMFTVIGTWIGAALLAFLAVALEIHQVVPLAVVLGVAMFFAAIVLARKPARSLARTQVIWALTLGAQGLGLAAMLEQNGDEAFVALLCTGLQLLTLVLIRLPSLQLVSTIAALGFATWLAVELELPLYPVWIIVPVVGLALATWFFEVPLAARLGRTWSALAHGLPLGLIIPLAAASLDADTVFAARNAPGMCIALLWLLVAHLRKSVELQCLALAQLGGFLFLFYYQLDAPLLLKSVIVIATGVVLLLAAWLGRSQVHPRHAAEASRERSSRWLPALALVVLTNGMVIGASLQKERVLATGQTVLLPLAPVDPRSLMQGDYMVLRYALENEIRMEGLVEGLDQLPRHDHLVIELDEDGVGRFVRFDDGRPLVSRQLRLEYRLRESGNLRIGGESFFFEEGSANVYQTARFAELVIAEDGEAVLVGLRDGDRQPLGVRLHEG